MQEWMKDSSYYYTVNSYGSPSSIFPLDKSFFFIMSSTHPTLLYLLAKYVKAAFYHRRKKLSESR